MYYNHWVTNALINTLIFPHINFRKDHQQKQKAKDTLFLQIREQVKHRYLSNYVSRCLCLNYKLIEKHCTNRMCGNCFRRFASDTYRFIISFQVWCNNSRLPVDNVLGGAFESAMRVRLQFVFKLFNNTNSLKTCTTSRTTARAMIKF